MKFRFFIERKRILLCMLFSAAMAIIYHFSQTAFSAADTVYGTFEIIIGYNDFFEFSIYNLNGVLLIFILSFPLINYFVKDYRKIKVYIFTRIKSRKVFIACRQAALLLYCFTISAVYFAVKLILYNQVLNVRNVLCCFLIFFSFLLVFCSFVCTLSLVLGSVRAYLCCILSAAVFCLAVTVYYFEYNAAAEIICVLLNPAARFMLNWGGELAEMLSGGSLAFMNIGVSAAFYALLYILSLLLSAKIINNNKKIRIFDEE